MSSINVPNFSYFLAGTHFGNAFLPWFWLCTGGFWPQQSFEKALGFFHFLSWAPATITRIYLDEPEEAWGMWTESELSHRSHARSCGSQRTHKLTADTGMSLSKISRTTKVSHTPIRNNNSCCFKLSMMVQFNVWIITFDNNICLWFYIFLYLFIKKIILYSEVVKAILLSDSFTFFLKLVFT